MAARAAAAGKAARKPTVAQRLAALEAEVAELRAPWGDERPRGQTEGPQGLDPDLLEMWVETRDRLVARGDWTMVARSFLDQLAEAFQAARTARSEARETPFVEGSQNQLVAHPGTKVAEAAEGKALAIATKLKILPTGGEADAGDADPMEAILGGD